MSLYIRQNIQDIDKEALEKVSLDELINEVGESLAKWFEQNISCDKKILILAGPGHNGKDGQALHSSLLNLKYKSHICFVLDNKSPKLEDFDVIVDAIFGTSINRPIEGELAQVIKSANEIPASQIKRISIDLASGVDPDSGKIWGQGFKADETLVIGGFKPGLFLLPGRQQSRRQTLIHPPSLNEGFTKKKAQKAFGYGEILSFQSQWLKKLRPNVYDHKYSRGKLVLVMDPNYPGACLLAAQAADAAGAGYVKILCPKALLENMQTTYPQFVFQAYNSEEDLIKKLIDERKTKAYALGPGWTHKTSGFIETISKLTSPLVLDGGLLQEEVTQALKNRSDCVLTPHTAELERLSSGESKWEQGHSLIKKFSGVLVAKGYDTLIMQTNKPYIINTDSSPFLAKAGTGDVLTGLIASFIAQGLSPYGASQFAVYLHSEVGKELNWELQTPQLINKLSSKIKALSDSMDFKN